MPRGQRKAPVFGLNAVTPGRLHQCMRNSLQSEIVAYREPSEIKLVGTGPKGNLSGATVGADRIRRIARRVSAQSGTKMAYNGYRKNVSQERARHSGRR
jgi:hypothetical protein